MWWNYLVTYYYYYYYFFKAHHHKACRREKLSNLTAATMFHSVTIVFWKATAFPCWRAMDSR